MKLLRRLTIAILLLSQCAAPFSYAAATPITVTPPPVVLPSDPLLITSYLVDTVPVYVQIYNSSSDLLPLSGWSLDYTLTTPSGESVDGALALSGYIRPAQYLVIGREGVVTGSDLTVQFAPNTNDFQATNRIALANPAYLEATPTIPLVAMQRYALSTSSAGNYTKTSRFDPVATDLALNGGGYYDFVDSTGLRITELLANQANCAPLETSANCHDFVELQNRSDDPVDLVGYRLRLGAANVAVGMTNNIPLAGVLAPHDYLVVNLRSDGKPLDLTAGGGAVWLEDSYGLHTYAETIVTYPDFSATKLKGFAYALDDSDGVWRTATTATPGAINDFTVQEAVDDIVVENTSGLAPCAANQFRNPETNRCKLIASTSSTLQPCATGQYRSPETNRCRSLTTADTAPKPCAANQYRNPDTGRCKLLATEVSALQPCNDNQFRNPDTGRCKLIADATSTLKPCAANQERNPDTNRCRKVASSTMPTADFPVESVATTAKSFVGWYALGGILLLGAGYGIYEWHHEIGRIIAKAATVVRRR